MVYVSHCTSTMDGNNTQVIWCKTPDGQSLMKRGDKGVTSFQYTISSKHIFPLTSSFSFNRNYPCPQELFMGQLGLKVNLFLDQFKLIFDPLFDLLSVESELARSVGEIKDRNVRLGINLSPNSEDAFARCRYRASHFVSQSGSESDNAVDGGTNFKGHLGIHDNMHATSLSLHETSSSAACWSRHLIWLTHPIANSVVEFDVAPMLANLKEPSLLKSSKPPAIMTLALPERMLLQAISMD